MVWSPESPGRDHKLPPEANQPDQHLEITAVFTRASIFMHRMEEYSEKSRLIYTSLAQCSVSHSPSGRVSLSDVQYIW